MKFFATPKMKSHIPDLLPSNPTSFLGLGIESFFFSQSKKAEVVNFHYKIFQMEREIKQMEKVPIVVAVRAAKANWKEAKVEPKSETGEGNGNKSGDAEVVGDLDDSGKKESLAEVVGDLDHSGKKESLAEVVGDLDDSGKKQSLAEVVGDLDDSGKKESLAEVVGDLDDSGKKQNLAEVGGVSKMATKTEKCVKMFYKKTKSNDADDDEEAVKGCMSWLL